MLQISINIFELRFVTEVFRQPSLSKHTSSCPQPSTHNRSGFIFGILLGAHTPDCDLGLSKNFVQLPKSAISSETLKTIQHGFTVTVSVIGAVVKVFDSHLSG